MRLALILPLVLLAAPALAQGESDDARYAQCLDHDAEGAEQALEDAFAWERQGGGARAGHCIAIAFLRLGEEEEAATRLEALVDDPLFAGVEPRAELMRQAASAWLLAGDLARAEDAAGRALAVSPRADLYVLRAQARMEAENYSGAESDLTEALSLEAANADALVWRAQARMAQGDLAAAQEDAEAAVEADPRSVPARLVLGDIREARRTATPAE